MGYRCNVANEKEGIKIRSLRNQIAQIKSLFGCGTNQKRNTFNPCYYFLIIILMFFSLVTSGYAIDVTLKWTPNNEPNIAGYTVFYRQEGWSYDYTNPYWETTDSACTIYDLDETKTYYFIVRAFSIEGFQSGNSNEVSLKAGTTMGN